MDSYANNLVTRSIEQDKSTTELQKQYERLLVEVKELASRPSSFSNKIMFVNDELISSFMHGHTHIHTYN
jgi:chaperonin cofactor prefoldin